LISPSLAVLLPGYGCWGVPIASPAHSAGALDAVVKVSKQAHLLLTEMDDPQVELLLLRALGAQR
jgi:hypothetical protein